uniref:Immunoglobulin V-set domain-containing protein n=1 Tax=Stegastes partitus TaxID=144197 RepID=A0A3B5AXN0_9TELE
MSLILLLLCIVLLIPIMRTSGICAGIFKGTYNGSVTISCQYSLQFKEYTKYWCKGQVYELCTIIVKTPKVRQNDRSSIVDDKEAGVFTVTMTLLQKTDEDMYWCVIARHGRNIFSRMSKATIIQENTTNEKLPIAPLVVVAQLGHGNMKLSSHLSHLSLSSLNLLILLFANRVLFYLMQVEGGDITTSAAGTFRIHLGQVSQHA